MLDDPFASLSLIAGPAIMMNATAILQNGATTRYNLAIVQWRELRASLEAHDLLATHRYVAPRTAVVLVQRRIHLQLRGLGFLNAAVALFAATTVLALASILLLRLGPQPPPLLGALILSAALTGFLALLAAAATLFLEAACSGALLRLNRDLADGPAAP